MDDLFKSIDCFIHVYADVIFILSLIENKNQTAQIKDLHLNFYI